MATLNDNFGFLDNELGRTTPQSNASTNPSTTKATPSETITATFNPKETAISLFDDSGGEVKFSVSPEIEESGSTIYISIDDIRAPASIRVWMGSPSRTFSINAKLLSRTREEADINVSQKSLLQAWRMPKTGAIGGGGDSSLPEILGLNGYGGQFQVIPVTIESLNISYPTDVDYIKSSRGFDVPIVWPISITLREFQTPEDMQKFDYEKYKNGNLSGWT